jgi:macrolide transport system ATP-binding/permease protein
METLFRDIHYGIRSLLKRPGFTAVAVITLALGIGVNTSIFTLFYSLALRPLPVKDASEIVNVYQTFEGQSPRRVEGNMALLSYPEYLSYRDETQAFSGLIAYADAPLTLSGDEGEKVYGLLVSDNYFSVLGAQTLLGRSLMPGECQTTGQCPLAVVSYRFWQRRFGSEPGLVGKTLTLNRQRFTVVGITAPDFRGTEMTLPDVWIPLLMQPALKPGIDFIALPDCSWLNVVGRLQKGVSLRQAQAELALLATQADREYTNRKTTVDVVSGAYLNFPEARSRGIPIVEIVMLAVGLVLLIACANVSNLLLARAATRKKEIAVRLALGASRGRLIRQLLTESLLLAVCGGAAGLLVAYWLPPILLSVVPETGADVNFSPNLTVLAYAFVISMITGVIFGLAPALQATKLNLTSALQGTAVSPRFSSSRLRSALVVTQVAVSLVLLISAGLLLRSLQRAQATDRGFDPVQVLALSLDTTAQGYDSPRTVELYRQLTERLAAMPGVKSVGLASAIPFAGTQFTGIEIEDPGTKLAGRSFQVNVNVVSPSYFQTLGIPLLRGRQFSGQEVTGSQSVAVVSKAMTDRFWPNQDPIGKHFKDNSSSYEIIGVASDISSIDLAEHDGPLVYLPAQIERQTDKGGLTVLLKTGGNPSVLAGTARDVVRSLDKNLVVSVKQLEENLDSKLQPARTGAMFSGALSLLALLLAATGIYGVMAYFVTERTREIGIRVALGAQTSDVLKLVVRNGMRLALIGVVIGLTGSFALARLMSSFLLGVAPTDALTFAVVSVGLIAIALVACYIPARRATKVDPLVALRYE